MRPFLIVSMTFFETFNADFKSAMKEKNEAKLSTLRMLKAALKNKQIDLIHELSEEEALAVVKSQIKQLKDSLEPFEKGGRTDMAESIRAEIATLEVYLPAQMEDATLKQVIGESLKQAGLTTKADMGKAMGVAMKAVAGRADGGRVRPIVEALLAVFLLAVFFPGQAQAAVESGSGIFLETALRLARIFFLLMGLICVNSILVGAFTFMTGSGRDHAHHHGQEKIAWGLIGSILMGALFSIATVALQRLHA